MENGDGVVATRPRVNGWFRMCRYEMVLVLTGLDSPFTTSTGVANGLALPGLATSTLIIGLATVSGAELYATKNAMSTEKSSALQHEAVG